MKIALFSDVHANLPALEAVFSDIDGRKPDAIYCLGDLVGYAPWPNEVIEAIRARHIPTIAGNYDYGVGQNSNECGCAYKTDEDKKRGERSIRFTNGIITDDNRSYLKSLPSHFRMEAVSVKQKQSLLMVHGSPRKINEYLYEDRPDESFRRMMEAANTHLLAFGHTHKPFHKIIKDGQTYRHAINIGSVGKPKDGDPRACYAMLEWEGIPDFSKPGAIEVTFHRVEYEVEQAAEAIIESELPNAFADMLRNAY
ncbi:metallophosphoesterase family protein [Fodinibius halophilus]|uniref:Metallophosphoesterase family protein n=1 Tax=Fodinibius halophilus TaxID=1736908 RepID=A0A6M1T008_9BACT|nr:metallophosphoesterase family protein [Fodinibius halophilus]NGP88836.1 metallophosphoesterase family protein [Fodinibius halophilus]